MINNVHFPEKGLYVIGSKIVELLLDNSTPSINVINLHDDYEIKYGNISYAYFIYALDWLFIVGIVDINNKGDLVLCS